MRHYLVRVAVLAGLLTILQAPSLAAPVPFWQKTWTIAAISGTADQTKGIAGLVGKPVTLSPTKVETPLTEPCATAPDYRDVIKRPRARLGRHFGAFWRWPPRLGAMPVYGWVRCERTNVGAFAFADAAHGYLFYEDGIVVSLR